MDSRIMDVLKDRVLELGPAPATGPYKNFKLTRDDDGIAWLLFDREGTSANTLSEDVLVEFETVIAALGQDRPAGISTRKSAPTTARPVSEGERSARPARRRTRTSGRW